MNQFSRYEFFIAHFVPGVLGVLALVLMLDQKTTNYIIKSITDLKSAEMLISSSLTLILIISAILSMGLILDALKSLIISDYFKRRLEKEKIEVKNYLMDIKTITKRNYDIVLNEYYYYYESAINCALALLFLVIATLDKTINLNLTLCGWRYQIQIWWILFLLMLVLLRHGFRCYKNYVLVCNRWIQGKNIVN